MNPHKDSVQRIIEILKDTYKGGPFMEFYDGDPELIPEFNLPCLIVSELSDTTDTYSNAEDDVVDQIVIKVIFNKKDDFKADVDPLNMTERKIRDIIKRIDPDTGRYADNTIKNAIRTHLSEANMILDGHMSVELGINPRPSEVLTAEGHVTIPVRYSVDVL